jgi:4-amino-4-deoxy-L-arabinose transferase-like glycosyltransferase
MTKKNLSSNRDFAFVLLIILMIAVGCFRIFLACSVFWQTWDEPFHIAAGMEWLDKGQYTYERFHPPLARVMSALGLYLNGIRGVSNLGSPWAEGSAILQAGGAYEQNLILARIGILPFFVIASLVVALWAKHCGGMVTSLLATLLFTTLPPILAHSGLATLDMACATQVSAALFALTLWLSQPTLFRSCILGICISLAILSKLSAIGFLAISGSLIIAIHIIRVPRKIDFLENQIAYNPYEYATASKSRNLVLNRPVLIEVPVTSKKISIKNLDFPRLKRLLSASIIVFIFSALTIWAGYRFSSVPLFEAKNRPYEKVDRIVGTEGLFHNVSYFLLEHTSMPAPEFSIGIQDSLLRSKQGHLAYLLGNIRRYGWWYFYPIALLVKTPLSFILLNIIGFFVILRNIFRGKQQLELLVPAFASLGILAVGMLSSVDNGIRQILSIYPLLAIVAGYGAFKLISVNKTFKFVGLALVTILFSWQLISSFAAHTDYLAYFNELARNHPEEILVDSDLDWGQDLKRLTISLKKRGINEFKIKYNNNEGLDLSRFDLPKVQELKPYQRETGWIAISLFYLQLGMSEVPYDQFSWLKEYQPVEQVGKSIWLYYIPEK